MKQLTVVLSLLWFSSVASGEVPDQGGSATEKKNPKIKVEHSISEDRASNKVTIEGKIRNLQLMQGYLSKKLLKEIESLPGVKSIHPVFGKEKKEKSWSFGERKRDSHIMVQFDFVTPVTMMFKMEEAYRVCNLDDDDDDDDDDDYDDVDTLTTCPLKSSVRIEGPIAVYGTFAGASNQEMLMQNQVLLEFSYGMNYGKTDTEVESTFVTTRMDFNRALGQFLKWARWGTLLKNPAQIVIKQTGRSLKDINTNLLKEK